MIGTIDLYKLALTPNDTLYFDSVNDQTTWFNNQTHLSIDNISFNGARAFQIESNYLDLIFNYNYVRYKLNNRYIYAFIENIDYANDNCATLNISIDLNQTFLTELQTAISTSNIGNITKKDSYFKDSYKPYDNNMTVPYYKSINLGRLNPLSIDLDVFNYHGKYVVGYIALNIDRNVDYGGNSVKLTDNGFASSVYCYVMPILYSLTSRQLVDFDFKAQYSTGLLPITVDLISSKDFNTFITSYGSYLESGCVSICFEPLGDFNSLTYDDINNKIILHDAYNPLQPAVERIPQKQKYIVPTNANGQSYPFGENKYLINIYYNYASYSVSIDLSPYISDIPYAILRQPYMYIRIGTDKDYISLNLAEFEHIRDNNILDIIGFTSCIYPFTTNLRFFFNGGEYVDRNALFNLTTTIPVPYTLSAWQEYFARNQASVNDGLATQQNYERQISNNTKNFKQISSAIEWGSDSISAIAKLGSGNPVGALTGFISSTTKMGTSIAGADVEYTNSELQRQKEKALLDISWNDIKSSPSQYSNTMSNMTSLYRNGIQNIEIDLYYASNLNDIIKYHKQYGYKVNRMETLAWADIKQHTVFDYIAFNTITLKSTLPQFYTFNIEQQYEQGVRFWYDYANFMNYQIENTERGI